MPTTLIIPPGYGAVKLSWQMTGKAAPVSCTFGVQAITLAGPYTDIPDDVFAAATASGSIFEPSLSGTQWRFLPVEMVYNDAGTMVGVASSADAVSGTFSGLVPPSVNCSLVVKKLSAVLGRKNRGRFYAPITMVDEGGIDQMGNISAIPFGSALAMWQGFFDNLDAITELVPVILHSAVGSPTPITSFVLESQIGTQRRRMR